MTKKILHLTLFLISMLSLMAFIPNDKEEIKNANLINELLEKMHFIQGREFTASNTDFRNITDRDTALLFWNEPYRDTVESFYISATEVTNVEWWDFYMSMRNKLGEEKAKNLYYPDTLAWHKEFPYSSNGTMTRNYFWHTRYDDYPVVGVSWVQAQAYCQWKTKALRNAASRRSELKDITFRLPSQNEWELAAYNLPNDYHKNPNDRRITDLQPYPWNGVHLQRDGEHQANCGQLVDQNGVILQHYSSDGALYTSRTGQYPPNYWGLYDMAGNVTEWVANIAEVYEPKRTIWSSNPKYTRHPEGKLYKGSDIDAYIMYIEEIKRLDKDLKIYCDDTLQRLLHDKKILSEGDKRYVKGGAWSDGPAYLQIGSREAFEKNKKSCRIGFRVAISYDEKYEDYFPKKYWKPKGK